MREIRAARNFREHKGLCYFCATKERDVEAVDLGVVASADENQKSCVLAVLICEIGVWQVG